MTTITIPKTTIKESKLIAVPIDVYEEFLGWQKRIKSTKTFKPTAAEKRVLARARKDLAHGKYLTLDELRYELGFTR